MITSIEDLENKEISFGTPQAMTDGKMFSKAETRLIIRLELLKTLGEIKNDVTFEVPSSKTQFLNIVDDKTIQQAVSNSKEWFNKDLSKEAIESMFKKTIQVDDKHRLTFTPSTFKQGDSVKLNVFKNKNEKMNIEDVSCNTTVSVLVQLWGITFSKKSFSPMWKIHQMKVNLPKKNVLVKDYAFDDDSSDEDLS